MKSSLLFAVVVLLVVPVSLQAHGSEESFEQTVDDHFVDVGFDTPFSVGNDTLLDFSVFDAKGKNAETPSPYTSVVVTLESGALVQWKRVVLKPEFGKPVTSLLPEQGGNWVFRTLFLNGSETVADAQFPVLISGTQKTEIPVSAVFAGIIFALAALVFAVFRSRPV